MTDWAALGRAVKVRRDALRLSQGDLIDRGGPSDLTVRRIERGEIGALRNKTKTKLESALDWSPGTVDEVLSGTLPADQVEPGPKFPTLADAEELTMSHSAGRWVPQGIGDLIRAEYRRRGERIAALERELTAEAHPPNPAEEEASVAALRRGQIRR